LRKILLLIFILMLSVMSTAFAYSDESNADAQKVLDSIKEIRYNVEAGVNFQDYSSLVSKAAVNFRKYEDKYSSNDKDPYLELTFQPIIDDYKDAREVWRIGIYSKYNGIIGEDELVIVFAMHPTLKSKLSACRLDYGNYNYKDVMQTLWTMAANEEKDIDNRPQQ